MNRTIADMGREQERLYGTEHNTFQDFPIGTRVKVITPIEDFMAFDGDNGVVIHNNGQYLGNSVKFDKPFSIRGVDGLTKITSFNFNPKSICILNEETEAKARKNQKDIDQERYDEQQSKRFMLLDL